MKAVLALLSLLIATPALAQDNASTANSVSDAIARQIGQMAIANAQLTAQNVALQKQLNDLKDKCPDAAKPNTTPPTPKQP